MMDAVNDFLVTYLDSIDESLLEYLEEADELKLDAAQRLSFYTTALLDRSITAHQAPDYVDVLSRAHEDRGMAVTPPVGKVPTDCARRGPGLHDQVVQRWRS
jgi:hypothetical protein